MATTTMESVPSWPEPDCSPGGQCQHHAVAAPLTVNNSVVLSRYHYFDARDWAWSVADENDDAILALSADFSSVTFGKTGSPAGDRRTGASALLTAWAACAGPGGMVPLIRNPREPQQPRVAARWCGDPRAHYVPTTVGTGGQWAVVAVNRNRR